MLSNVAKTIAAAAVSFFAAHAATAQEVKNSASRRYRPFHLFSHRRP